MVADLYYCNILEDALVPFIRETLPNHRFMQDNEAYSTLRNETKRNETVLCEMVLCETVLCEMVLCETVLCETVTTQCFITPYLEYLEFH